MKDIRNMYRQNIRELNVANKLPITTVNNLFNELATYFSCTHSARSLTTAIFLFYSETASRPLSFCVIHTG